MQSKKLAKAKAGPSTQRFLDIAEIRENVVVLKDGTMRAVMMSSSINFALKSEDEQQAIVQGYMQFLNGLEYPIEIVIQSRKMNIDGYLDRLKKQEDTIANELLKSQIRDYTSFITELVELGEIMQKRFFVVVPFDPVTDKSQKNFMAKVSAAIAPASLIRLNDKVFNTRRESLQHRVDTVAGGLSSMGLQVVQLDTQGLIELYYTVYNPDLFDNEKMADVNALRVETKF